MAKSEPLWRVMYDAYYSVQQHPDVLSEDCERQTIAAEIRAIADWLVPDDTIEKPVDTALKGAAMERRALRDTLLAEADRAEAGDA